MKAREPDRLFFIENKCEIDYDYLDLERSYATALSLGAGILRGRIRS